jgi:hypothetical protein
MSTLAEHPPEITMAADDFQALEERVLRTVELLKGERELRYSVEQHAACKKSGKRCASASSVCLSKLTN